LNDDFGDSKIPSALLEPLEPILPPEGVVAVKLADIAARANANGAGRVDVAGVRGSGAAAVVAAIARAGNRHVVVVTSELEAARKLTEDVGFYLRGAIDEESTEETGVGEVLLFTANESSPYAEVNPDRRAGMSRMATLFHLAKLPWSVLVLPATALARKTVPRDVVVKSTQRIVAEEALDRDALIGSLSESGYLRVPLVEDPGTFAVRGSLVDVWPPNRELPVRVELYGELVVSIHEFDPHEQRTRAQEGASGIAEIWLPPAREAILDKANSTRAKEKLSEIADSIDLPTLRARALIDDVVSARAFFGADGYLPAYYKHLDSIFSYLDANTIFVLDEPAVVGNNVREDFERATKDVERKEKEPIFPRDSFFVSEDEVTRQLDSRRVVALHRTPVIGSPGESLAKFETTQDALDLASRGHEDLARAVKAARSTQGKTATLSPLVRRIHHFRAHGLSVFIAARAHTQAERLTALLRHQGVPCRARLEKFNPAWLSERSEETSVVVGPLTQGVVLPADGIVIVTEEEVFGARSHRRRERKAAADPARPFLEDLRSLSVGDFVVHGEHGVGKYLGLIHKQVGELTVDLICVEYAANDKLYLPVYRLNQIQKYSGGENAAPKLDRLGGSTFAKTKSKVKKAVRQMADELLRLYAERQAQPGHALGEIDEDYRAFEATFAFDETPDQQRAIAEVNKDLGTDKPMDRLVCGDVGFGKTEVALRAAFRVATAGKQVALLCPTTVLAQQHLRTFENRMAGYPIVIRAVSRFQTKKEVDETITQLKEGKVDVVIGTHRLLSKDIHFKDLGLLVVDEEQRFGVTHKERIKQIRAQVDVLTLTATPIPRTLQMAVGGLRDLSLITTPPVDRRAVRTIVTRFDDEVIREACERELSRGGQIFYVYNRVEGLYERAQKLQQLIPRARVAVAHGQMSEVALEEVMLDFVEGRYDVLCATAIIESGLDIPRANTMIIDRADLFGLAQLYQLRGRVGRSKERAYCYLIVPGNNSLSDEARSRIEALERHTELGSGFQIASLDLELRGAGDLLGGEQSGNVASVGFDLFTHMLEEAVQELRGEPIIHEVDPDLSFDVSALLPDDYIGEVGVRLSLYKRLASAIDEAHVQDIAVEMEDRFGPPPAEAKNLIELMRVKTELRRLMVLGCEANARSVTLHLREDTPLDPQKILELVRAPKSQYRLTPDMRLTRRFDGTGSGLSNAEELLAALAKCVKAA
jgi:transcription-repair coupling factor (superfamily II helicase)